MPERCICGRSIYWIFESQPGNTVDLTVWYIDGGLFTVPMGFDDFSLKVDRDYNDCTDDERNNGKHCCRICTVF